jgi:PKD domain
MRSLFDVAGRTIGARRALVAGALVAGALAALPASAGAVVTDGPSGPIGYLPVNGQGPGKAGFASNGNLDYHGGPVMPSNKQFAIFWAPAGFSFPADYKAGIIQYMQRVSGDSFSPTNTSSISAQYFDQSGNNAAYDMTFGGAVDATNAYPANGCPPYTGIANTFTTCLSDAQISAQVDAVVGANSLPRGLTNQYFVFLPAGVGSCIDSTNDSCFDKEFCAYHTSNTTGGTTVYANESYTPSDPGGCGTGNYPNGGPIASGGNGVDDQLSTLSHETNEARQDPLGTGWWNSNTGAEGADQCRNTADDYGPLIGGTAGVDGFNQIISGGHYILQQDWSNAANGCEQFYRLGGKTFAPSKARVGTSVEFRVRVDDFEGGKLGAAQWKFGDGDKAKGKTVHHTYKHKGTYTVKTIAVTNTGLALFGNRKIKIVKKKRHHRHHVAPVRAKLHLRG